MPGMDMLKLSEAARHIGVSTTTLKQWIYKGSARSVKTPGGHHRISRSEVQRLAGGRRSSRSRTPRPTELDAISGRNKLQGIVTHIELEGLLAQVTIDIGGHEITSIITRDSCKRLELRKGVRAFALIKATEVMVIRP
ncbi:MAG: helix-turn-helix transcriptional regulator [Acidobacteria bacterium]|nr:helix-turn-helix transcriptional regulator [Acidobacteriota bacterium]